jgi:MFS family permease
MFTAMGLGRFAYTPAISFMLEAGALNTAQAGFIASVNYLGYLTGAMYYSFRPLGRRTMENGLILSTLTTAAIPLMNNITYWTALRLLSGFFSAAVFIAAAERVYAALQESGKLQYSGLLFSGVGAGIAASSVSVPLSAVFFSWQTAWYVAGALSLAGSAAAVMMAGKRKGEHRRGKTEVKELLTAAVAVLSVRYFLEGAGYAISATFLVDIIKSVTGSADAGYAGWALAGLTAVFANLFWSKAGHRFGNIRVLVIALAVQAAGVALPAINGSIPVVLVSSLIFGGTFLGIVGLTLSAGRIMAPNGNTAPFLTVFFSVGQIVSPWLGGFIAYKSGSFELPLIASSAMLALGALLAAVSGYFYKRRMQCRS